MPNYEQSYAIANKIADEFLANGGDKKVNERFQKLVRDASKVVSQLPKKCFTCCQKNVTRLKENKEYFCQKVREAFIQEIRITCMDAAFDCTVSAWEDIIEVKGGVRKIFNRACREVQKDYDITCQIYADAFIKVYPKRDDAEKAMFAILAELPKETLEYVNDILIDRCDYTIHVDNGRLVVHVHD